MGQEDTHEDIYTEAVLIWGFICLFIIELTIQ